MYEFYAEKCPFLSRNLVLGDFAPNFGKKPLSRVGMGFFAISMATLWFPHHFGRFQKISFWPVRQVGYTLRKIFENSNLLAVSSKCDFSATKTFLANPRPDLKSPEFCPSFERNLKSSGALDPEIWRFKDVCISRRKKPFFRPEIGVRQFWAEFRQKNTFTGPDGIFLQFLWQLFDFHAISDVFKKFRFDLSDRWVIPFGKSSKMGLSVRFLRNEISEEGGHFLEIRDQIWIAQEIVFHLSAIWSLHVLWIRRYRVLKAST